MKKFILTAAAAVAALSAAAQTSPWSLSDCISYAMEHNISIRQRQNAVEQSEIELNTTSSSRLPGVSAGASQNFSFGRGLTADNTYANTNTATTGFSIGADMNLFNGFRTRNSIIRGKLDLEAATADLEKARDDIRVGVAQAYMQILYNAEIAEVADRQIEIDEQHVARISEMLANGKASEVELAQQEASLAQSRLTSTQAQNNLRLAILDLTQLLELPSPEGFSVVRPSGDAEGSILPLPEEIYAAAVSSKPAVRAEELRLESSASAIAIAKSSLYPSLSLSGGIGSNYYNASSIPSETFRKQLNNNFSQYIGLNLSIPIFSRFSVRNGIRSAELGRTNQQLQLESVKKALYKEIQQAYYGAVAAREKLAGSREAVKSSRASFELTEAKYENGKAGITEFNEAKNQYMKAESDLVQARYEYIYQTKLLDFYRGEELSF